MRHGLAVMAVGWYLLVPPMTNDPSDNYRWKDIHADAPLSQWDHLGSFDTADKCNHERIMNWGRYHEQSEAAGKAAYQANQTGTLTKPIDDRLHNMVWAEQRANLGRCIATDDPRLKAP